MSFRLIVRPSELGEATKVVAAAELAAIRLIEARVKVDVEWTPEKLEIGIKYETTDIRQRDDGRIVAHTRFELSARSEGVGEPALLILAVYELEYELGGQKTRFEESSLTAFGASSVLMNAWPYWREYAHSTVARVGLPPMVLPLLTLHTTQDVKTVGARRRKERPRDE